MKHQFIAAISLSIIASGVVGACAAPDEPQAETTPTEESATDATAEAEAESDDVGTLELRANGEDFVRQGFVSKDGWNIAFDHLYVNLVDVTAYQTDPPFDPDTSDELKAQTTAALGQNVTVDLAEGDDSAEPILLGTVSAPAGQYNALSWKMAPAEDGPAAGSTLMLVGAAQKDGETVNFNIRLDPVYTYACGEFVGDERKGILTAGDTSDVEATFHFDHIFGDGDAPADDSINTGALGFEPLAALASDGQLDVDMATLEEQLSAEDYALLEKTVSGLAHVGEGHCSQVEGTPS
ncbi:MAG: DUF4382 domain-containing protein [Leptolyngbyaceae bacterium]|nr:DUF4382 domain-containing protein [Leptolyngbyaceae bacterium]